MELGEAKNEAGKTGKDFGAFYRPGGDMRHRVGGKAVAVDFNFGRWF
jgi:hypothetical protein